MIQNNHCVINILERGANQGEYHPQAYLHLAPPVDLRK